MQTASICWLALAGCLLTPAPETEAAQGHGDQGELISAARSISSEPAVSQRAETLLALTLAGAGEGQLLHAIERIRADSTLAPAARDAAVHEYLRRLRDLPPGTAPRAVLDWLTRLPPMAVTGHQEGPHHGVALFNVGRAARGLINEWS